MQRAAVLRGAALTACLFSLAACAAGPSPRITAGASVPRIDAPLDLAADSTGNVVVFGGPVNAGYGGAPPRGGVLESSPTGDELAFVQALAHRMQAQSYATGRETCGYVGRDAQGAMMATAINVGQEASCYLPQVPAGMRLLASIHTHGTYSPVYASEMPTSQDMMTDAQDQVDGYIATPGGRLWYVDSDTLTVRQLCGRGCLPQDPHYRAEDDGPISASYSLQGLQGYEAGYR